MRFDLDDLDPPTTYKLLTATIVPRPIAWVTTLTPEGVVNAAPYSFFNAMGQDPPTVVIGMVRDPKKGFKDSARNILDRGEFVVSLVPHGLAGAMNLTSVGAPREVSELALAGLTAAPSAHVAVPRIAESPVAFECGLHAAVVTGPQQTIVIGRVRAVHVEDAFVLDAGRAWIDTAALGLVGRMGGAGWYARTTDLFQLERPDWDRLKAERDQASAPATSQER